MIVYIALLALLAGGSPAEAGQPVGGADVSAARSRVEARYEIVPLKDGIGLRPKNRGSRIRMIEISGGEIAVDGVTVSGRELRETVGADADAIIPLSYFDAAQRRAFLGQTVEPPPQTPREAPAPEPRVEPPSSRDPKSGRRRVGERVHVFSSVTVRRDESVDGQAIAIFGSVRVDGHVSDQVVAVMGSVNLGPDAVVDGDVVSVGGRINMADGAQVKGHINEINLRGAGQGIRWSPWWTAAPFTFSPFTGTARLIGTMLRLFLLGLFASIVVLLIRQPVEQIGRHVSLEPAKMALVGILAQMLFFPVVILTAIILAVSVIGIPLLLLIPFAMLSMLLLLLGGFTSVAYVVGGWGAARAGWPEDQPFLRVWLGVLIVLSPLLVGRLVGIIGGPFQLGATLFVLAAFLVEYIAWTTGLGAALTTGYERWRSRRSPPPNGIMHEGLPPSS